MQIKKIIFKPHFTILEPFLLIAEHEADFKSKISKDAIFPKNIFPKC
jgi:hypothetical protein